MTNLFQECKKFLTHNATRVWLKNDKNEYVAVILDTDEENLATTNREYDKDSCCFSNGIPYKEIGFNEKFKDYLIESVDYQNPEFKVGDEVEVLVWKRKGELGKIVEISDSGLLKVKLYFDRGCYYYSKLDIGYPLEEPLVELTKEQIEEKLGYKIKIVEEKK